MGNINIFDIAIIGGGPAGFSAAIYACRGGARVCVFAPSAKAGQMLKTDNIENYPGFPEPISGYELLEKMRKQAIRLGAEVRDEEIQNIDTAACPFVLSEAGGKKIKAFAIIAAMGAAPRKLGLLGEQEFMGRGLSSCAVCDGFFFKNKPVAIIGGGDSAASAAIYMASLSPKVYIIHRRNIFRAADRLVKKMYALSQIKPLLNYKVIKLKGGPNISGLVLKHTESGAILELEVKGVFAAIGQEPNSKLAEGKLKLLPSGAIAINAKCETSIAGIFAAGDVAGNGHRQIIIAAAQGAEAALSALAFLNGKQA